MLEAQITGGLQLTTAYTFSRAEFTDFEAARAYLDSHWGPLVIKASGLAAGKGVPAMFFYWCCPMHRRPTPGTRKTRLCRCFPVSLSKVRFFSAWQSCATFSCQKIPGTPIR